jgi:hypothetical protein
MMSKTQATASVILANQNLNAEKDSMKFQMQPKKKGRPKGPEKGPERVTKGSYKYKAGRPAKTKEDLDTDGVMMTRSQQHEQ